MNLSHHRFAFDTMNVSFDGFKSNNALDGGRNCVFRFESQPLGLNPATKMQKLRSKRQRHNRRSSFAQLMHEHQHFRATADITLYVSSDFHFTSFEKKTRPIIITNQLRYDAVDAF